MDAFDELIREGLDKNLILAVDRLVKEGKEDERVED